MDQVILKARSLVVMINNIITKNKVIKIYIKDKATATKSISLSLSKFAFYLYFKLTKPTEMLNYCPL